MKAVKVLLFGLLLVGLVFVAACTTGQSSAPLPPSGPIGGGCGVAPAADVGVAAVAAGVESTAAL
jgi:hypothetical protein